MAFGVGEILGIMGVAGVPATLALTMPATTRGEFRFLKGCLLLSGALIIVSLFLIEWKDSAGVEMKVLVNAAIAAIVVGSLTFGMDWLEKKQAAFTPVEKPKTAGGQGPAAKNSPNISAAGNVSIGQIGDIINQPAVPTYTGKIEAEKTESHLFGKNIPRAIEIGDSGARLIYSGPQGSPFMTFAENYHLKIDLIDGELKVSTQIRNRKGEMVAELVENEWKVALPPKTWDRNYNKNTIEVKDDTGSIVLQVRALPDRIQLQGDWWQDEIRGIRLVKDPNGRGGALTIFGPAFRPENASPILPLFRYPSERHLGELISKN